jgi:hypothetical protein
VRGYIDPETVMYQELRYKYVFLGITIWTRCYHSERIPAFAWMQNNALGSTDWISPYKTIINKHNQLCQTQIKKQ